MSPKNQLKVQLMTLKTKLGKFKKQKLNCDKMKSHIKVSHRRHGCGGRKLHVCCMLGSKSQTVSPQLQAQQTEKTIKEEFQKLYQFLRAEEAARVDAVRKEATLKTEAMKIRIINLTAEISSLTKSIETIEKEMRADDISFMLVFNLLVFWSWHWIFSQIRGIDLYLFFLYLTECQIHHGAVSSSLCTHSQWTAGWKSAFKVNLNIAGVGW